MRKKTSPIIVAPEIRFKSSFLAQLDSFLLNAAKMRVIYLLIAAQTAATFGARGTTFNAAADFSQTSNQNGAWSYGWFDGAIHPSTALSSYAPDAYFFQGKVDGPLGEPTIAKNEGSSLLVINNTTTYAPGVMAMHPGRNDQKAALRWTAPSAGTYTIAARFSGLDRRTSTDVSIRDSDGTVASGIVDGFKGQFDYFGQITLEQNGIFDFLVGIGSNSSFYYDTTRVDIIITDEQLIAPTQFNDPNLAGLPVYHLNWYTEAGPTPLFTRTVNVPDEANPSFLIIFSMAGCIWMFRKTSDRTCPLS
jgi:hypothetical protein